jgi:hypothetical protein
MDASDLYMEKENFLVVLDSRNATDYSNGDYHSSVHFDFSEPIRIPKNALRLLCTVLHFQSPNSLYNINETNNILYLTISENQTTYNLVKGNYNCTSFITYLLSILPSGFSVAINTITNKITVSYTSNFTISGTCGQIMGFSGQISVTSSSNSLTMPYTCNFNGLQSFNIHLTNILTKNIDSLTKSPSNIIQSIPVDVSSSSISYIKNADFNFVINQEVIDDMTIDLKDDQNNYLNFNNQHWNLTLYFSIVKDQERFKYMNNFHNILKYK